MRCDLSIALLLLFTELSLFTHNNNDNFFHIHRKKEAFFSFWYTLKKLFIKNSTILPWKYFTYKRTYKYDTGSTINSCMDNYIALI